MEKKEFLKQMVAFGQKLLEEENKKVELNSSAIISLSNLYDLLGDAVSEASDLERAFKNDKKKRNVKAAKAVRLIMQIQQLLNPIAEDDDIQLI